MSLSDTELRDKVLSQVNRLSDEDKVSPDKVHGEYASAMQDYIKSTLVLNGTYVGTIPGVPPVPDPLSGPHTWKLASLVLQGSLLRAGATINFDSWVVAIQTGISLGSFVGSSTGGAITLGAPMLLTSYNLRPLLSQQIFEGNRFEDMNSSVGFICSRIIDALLVTTTTPISVPATSTAGGVGTVTFASLT